MYSQVDNYQWNWVKWKWCSDAAISKNNPAFWNVFFETDQGGMITDYKGNALRVTQASYYLNQYLNMSFTDFLQFHRINEVKNMMRIKLNYNLLNIAFECGFNSASSFHRACVK